MTITKSMKQNIKYKKDKEKAKKQLELEKKLKKINDLKMTYLFKL